MPLPAAPVSRHVDALLLAADDVSVVDRATLSLWHFQQLLRPLLPSTAATSVALDVDDRDTASVDDDAPSTAVSSSAAAAAAALFTSVDLDDGMVVAAVAFAEADDALAPEPPATLELADANAAPLPSLLSAAHGHRVRVRRASITDSEMSMDDDADAPTSLPHARLTMASHVAVIYRRYRCVVCLDASPSALAIDVGSGKVFLEMLYESVELFVRSLLRPIEVGGSAFVPEFHVSVLVQGAFVESLCVLVQGFVLDLKNVDQLLHLVHERLALLEDDWAAAAARGESGVFGEETKHRATLSSMLQNAVFALNSLPAGAAPLLVLATDGVVDLPNALAYDSLVMQLVRHDIQCHFLRISGAMWNDPHASFGYVPDVDLLQLVAQASSGSVIEYLSLHQAGSAPPVSDSVKNMTAFQASLLVRSSKIQAITAPLFKVDPAWYASFDGKQYMSLRPYRLWREKVHEYRIHTDVNLIVEARIREGFVVNKVHVRMIQRSAVADGAVAKMVDTTSFLPDTLGVHVATKVLLVFVLQWKQNVWLEYVISSTIEAPPQGRAAGTSRSATTKGIAGSGGSAANASGVQRRDPTSSEWYVKVNVLSDAEFLRAFEDTRASQQTRSSTSVLFGAAPTALHEFIRNVQDVDRVLLHLMTAAASVVSAAESTTQFSFGNQAVHHAPLAVQAKTQSSHPVFGIIGELSPVLWHRWFHVDRFEVLSVVVDDPSPETFFPRVVAAPVMPRNSSVQFHTAASSRSRQSRRAGMSLDVNVHPLLSGKDHTVDRIRNVILQWSSQRLGKDLFLRFLSSGNQRVGERSKHSGAHGPPVGRRRQQRSSLNSAALAAQINASSEQTQLQQRREEPSRGALCFVRVEAKNHTLVVVHAAFFSASASTRRETLAELKSIVAPSDNHASSTPGSVPMGSTSTNQARKLVLSHRMLSRLLVTHDTLVQEHIDNIQDSSFDPEKPLVACCGGSELQLRSVFGAFMWYSSWKWRLVRNSKASVVEVMRHLHEARIRAGFWVLDWKLEEDGDTMCVASVIFGREILMEDENGHLKTSLIQYGIRRTSDNCLLTSFWMEPQYGFAKTTVARNPSGIHQHDSFHLGLRHAVGHDIPLGDLATASLQSASVNLDASDDCDEPLKGVAAFLDEGKLLRLIQKFIFDSDRHLLSCLHTFETVASLHDAGSDGSSHRYSQQLSVGIVGAPADDEEDTRSCSALVPAFSTARLLEASKRSTEHFLMYLERGVPGLDESLPMDDVPTLSSANIYLYSMLERTLRSLSDCEVAWTDYHGDFVTNNLDRCFEIPVPTTTSQLPVWFLRGIMGSSSASHSDRHLSQGRCFAKLLPNDTVVFAFLPSITCLKTRRRSLLSPTDRADKNVQKSVSGLERWHQQHQLKPAASMGAGEVAAASSNMLKMSVSADDIVLYQERRQSFREGYKSWRMGHFHGAKDDKSHRTGHSGQLSPHPKVASFSEDYEFCESVCQEAEVGCDFHLLIEKADGVLGSGYFQVAFYECSLAELSASLTAHPWGNPVGGSHEALLSQLFAQRVSTQRIGDPAAPPSRAPTPNRRGMSGAFGGRVGLHAAPPPPLSIPVEPSSTGQEDSADLAVLHSSKAFRKKVKRAHEHNFSRGIYVALRDGAPVQQSDLIQALSSCVEVPMDLDITLLYRMLQVDLIRETVPQSALRSSMIDMLSGKSIRDALKERLDKSLEGILATVFHSIEDTKYFFFVGSENMAFDDAVGIADTEGDAVQLLGEDEVLADVDPTSPPRLVKSLSMATVPPGFGDDRGVSSPLKTGYLEEGSLNLPVVELGDDVVLARLGEGPLNEEEQHQHQINQEEDAELNKDVAAATSSFSSPFFFRFECRELVRDVVGRPRSTSSGVNKFEIASPAPRQSLKRSASSKSIMDPMGTAKPPVSTRVPLLTQWQRKLAGDISVAEVAVKGAARGISEIAEWAAEVSGPKIALRLVTLTLPNEQLLERTRSHQQGLEMDDKRPKVTPAEMFSSLPVFQRQVIKRMRRSIKEWSSTEILRILRSVECITPEIGSLVQKLFKNLPEECRTTVKYPVSFVNVHHETVDPMKLLEKELLLGTDSLSLMKCGELFFVVDRISVEAVNVPYWAFFKLDDAHITMQLHHEPVECSDGYDRLSVLTSLHLAVSAVCKRVNQFLLLLQLHETRTCNELLIPADPGTTSVGPPSPTASGATDRRVPSVPTFFWPGQFECDRKYAAFFYLNERMVPSIALTTLCTQALEQFQVHNRRHVFVYRDRGGHVFYIKMSAASSDALTQPSAPSVLRRSNSGSPGGKTPTGILLEVFGVCNAGEEVTQELCRLLERKLDETMQLILMKLLARNTKFQLSPSDMAFMCPPGVNAASSTVYKIPCGFVPASDAPTLLLFLCQTLGMTSYMRQINTSQHPLVTAPTRYERQPSIRSIVKPSESDPAVVTENASNSESTSTGSKTLIVEDASISHPAWFGNRDRKMFEELVVLNDSAAITPVFFTSMENQQPALAGEKQVAPVVLGDASFAINLNSELRLSPGFLSRVGKGLAVLRVEVLQCDVDCSEELKRNGSDFVSLDVGHALSELDPSAGRTNLFVRCQLWVRGPIQVHALRDVYQAHLKESLCDYSIEAAIRIVRSESKTSANDEAAEHKTDMPDHVSKLTSLLEASTSFGSSSVTKLALPSTIQAWDLEHVASQVHRFLTASLPIHARPGVYVAQGSRFARADIEEIRSQEVRHVKLIPMPPTLEHAESPARLMGLVSSDSVHSELSEMDSIASVRVSVGSSTIESLNAGSLHGSSSSILFQVKEFSTSELMFHSMAKGAGAESAKSASAPVVQQRTFYYVVDMSVADGMVLYGYNLSHQVVDAVAFQLARVMTWTILRDRMLQGLLLQRGGVSFAAPVGSSVVQPRLLSANGALPTVNEFTVSRVDFQTTIVPILQAFAVVPKSVETVNRLDLTPFGRLLKELGVQVIERGELQRSRSRNPASHRALTDEAGAARPGSSSIRSGIVSASNSQRSLAADKAPVGKSPGGNTVQSPTKRTSLGGGMPALAVGPSGQASARAIGPSASTAARMRANPTAANALMAARARARGGGFPGKMGGGPGVGANRSPGEVAPWDLPVTNTKNVVPAAPTAKPVAPPIQRDASNKSVSSAAAPTPALVRGGSVGSASNQATAVQKRPSATKSSLQQATRAATARGESWRETLAKTWGPQYKYYVKNAFVQTVARDRGKIVESETSGDKSSDPLRHYGAAFQRQQQMLSSCVAASTSSFELLRRIQEVPDREPAIEISDESVVQRMMQTGHLMLQQRFRVSYIERWEVVKIDDEYVEDGSNTGRMRALQASMDLVNLLSYKEAFVFHGNERVVAKLLTEHTVQAMCGKEGQAVREMKLQILKAVFHSRMDVVQRFFDQYAAHLRTLGFHHLRLPTTRLGGSASNKEQVAITAVGNSSASGSGSVTPTRSSVDAFASEGEAFSEFFAHRGGVLSKPATRGQRNGQTAAAAATSKDVLLLELKCDHSGVQVGVVLLSEQDLRQQHLGHQRHLDRAEKTSVQGEVVRLVSQSLRGTLDTRMLIHDFTVRFFHQCLLDWTLRKPDGSPVRPQSTTSSLHNMVKGVRSFLRSYPSSDRTGSVGSKDCALAASTVELPVRNLQSDFSESILVKILLRYIACHGSRYEVTDLTQFGTPDTIACHSAAGNFFSRQAPHSSTSTSSSSTRSGGSITPTLTPGYSLLITTQELWKGKKRPKTSVLLALVRSVPTSAILLPTERAMQEAELFVKELFRAAAANYERDLLWSRLLHSDSQGPSADVAHVLSLPVEYFRVEVGPQQLEECLRLSVCIPLEQIDPELSELLEIDDVCWQEFALRLRDVYAGDVREYQFEGQAACHFLLLCPDARDLMIHLMFPSGITNATLDGDANRLHIDICRREEPANLKFSLPQRRAITDFVNSVVHWLWRCLLYD